jgi:4-amino-4-deoxy-L-arabinose transferase-like glycosyltransferase
MKTASHANLPIEKSNDNYLVLWAFIFAALVLRLLVSPPIWHHGEAREGLVVQTIVNEHQWVLPLRNGELPSKPPLFHWIAALLAHFFGISDFVIRLPSAIGAVIAAIAIFLLGGEMDDRKMGWFAVGAFLGMYEFWDATTQARVDMVFAACVTGSLVGFFFWYRNRYKVARSICYLASACAVLAKGPAGIVLPGLVIGGFLVLERQVRLIWKFWSWPLIGAVLLIDVGWYALAYQVGGADFLGVQLWRENVDRFLGADRFSTRFTNLDLVSWLATQTFPWNLALLWSVIRRLRGEPEDSSGRFLHTWCLAIFGFFVFSAGRRAIYLLPMYPAIAVLAARAIAVATSGSEGTSGSSSKHESSSLVKRWFCPTARRVGVAIALLDLAILLVHSALGSPPKKGQATLAFAQEINVIVPAHRPLFASGEISSTDLIVIAYRSGRRIERKSIANADRNDYFLTSVESPDLRGVGMGVLAFSEINKVALVSVLKRDASGLGNESTKSFPVPPVKFHHPKRVVADSRQHLIEVARERRCLLKASALKGSKNEI